jgi:hypothetical protein
MPLRQLESEAVRDAILAAGGRLEATMGGPPVPLEVRPDGMVVVKTEGSPAPAGKWRRSIYLLARRNYPLSLLGVFDQPVVSTNCTRRLPSAAVTQSLTMLNDAFVLEAADHLAERVTEAAASGAVERRIELAFEMTLTRGPGPEETAWCLQFLRRQAEGSRAGGASPEEAERVALHQLCHTLLTTNEFLYVP